MQNKPQTSAVKLEESQSQSMLSQQELKDLEGLDAVVEILQKLVVEPKLAEFRHLIVNLEEKLAKFQPHSEQPTELFNVLLVLRTKLLNLPINQDNLSMGEAIVSEFAQENLPPMELANELAAAINTAIKAQIKLELKVMREAQASMVEQQVAECRQLLVNLAKKQAKLEHQISDPTELLNLLSPLKDQLLNLTTKQSMTIINESLAPIIDQVIQNKTRENKISMGEAIAPAIPVAITRQTRDSPMEVANAIAPEIASAVKEQIKLDRPAMVDALYPIVGSTTATYLAEQMRIINEKLENALSLEGVTRKFRANIQGVSEAELLLKETMRFSIQGIFLIHKTSGLVISEVQHSDSKRLESDMVAGMLTAICNFINDCIRQTGDAAEINEINYGSSKIILELGGYCYLAVVINGEPPMRFLRQMRRAVRNIVQNHGDSIKSFEGDCTIIPKQVNSILEQLFNKASGVKVAKPPALVRVSLLLLFVTFMVWGFFEYRHSIDRRIEADIAQTIASAPELSVYRLNIKVEGGRLRLYGRVPSESLRTKAETIAKQVEPNLNLENKIIVVEVPPDPVLITSEVQRLTSILNQINGVAISTSVVAGKVTVKGTISRVGDSKKIIQAFEKIPGVQSATDALQKYPLTIATRIYFDSGSANLKPADLDTKIIQLKEFLNQYPEQSLRIIGHSDFKSTPGEDQQLALQRAIAVRDALVAPDIDIRRLQVSGTTNPPADLDENQPLWLTRCVEIEPVSLNFKSN